MNIDKYEALSCYLQYLRSNYNLHTCICDYSGIVKNDHEFGKVLYPSFMHGNEFCMYVKSSKELFNMCYRNREKIYVECMKKKQTYFGMCYAGAEEFVVPVFHEGKLILAVLAGVFRQNDKKALNRMKKISVRHGLSYETLFRNYYSALSPKVPDSKTITSLLSIAARYLEYIYTDISHACPDFSGKGDPATDHILPHALEFINNHYSEPLYVSDIARHCYCSVSHMSHIFNDKMKMSIKYYMNKLRVEEAKRHLSESEMPIKNIASLVGFNDPNYFSGIFKDICGVFPTQYRRDKKIGTR